MRLKLLGLAILSLLGVAIAQTASTTSTQAPAPGSAKPFVITDDLRRHVVAVNFQDNGRIARPKSWDELDTDQKTLVDDLLNSPRGRTKEHQLQRTSSVWHVSSESGDG